jgi:hypothetical protein
MAIDFEKMTSVELETSIQNYIVKYHGKDGREMEVWVERTFIENDPASEDFAVVYAEGDGRETTLSNALSNEDQHEVIALVKSFLMVSPRG